MAIAGRSGLPLAIDVTSASPHEVTLVESTLAARFVVRYEYYAYNYQGFVHLGCIVVLLRWYL